MTADVELESENPYVDEWGHHMGTCNSCGEEAELYTECCDDGEVVPYDDDPDPEA